MLSLVFKSFLIHGHFSLYLLLATFIPILKDKLGSMNNSKNYRSIAISSLVLKLFDWIFLLIYGEKLELDDLQYAYQPGCSTTMCTWSVLETIDYFIRNGSEVYTCCMDMTKAFDMLKHSILFKKLIVANIPPVFVRLLMYLYMHQFANVKWNGVYSEAFPVANGVRQGGVSSAILYYFYCNILFQKLRLSGYGCWVNGNYNGIFGYSDDNLLLAPSQQALQKMLLICEKFADEHNLKFSTDVNPSKCKTKCTAFSRKPVELTAMKLCGNSLPWVNQFKHLGNTISNDLGYIDNDMNIKRAQYVNKCMELRQEFYFAAGDTLFELNQIYNSHFTGSPLWNLFGKHMSTLESSYNQSVKNMFNLPLATHRCLISPITNYRHIRITLYARFLNFVKQLKSTNKKNSRLLFYHIMNDVGSTTGKNLRKIMLQTNKDTVDVLAVKDVNDIKYYPLTPEDEWKPILLKELTKLADGSLVVDGFTTEELNQMIYEISVN